VRYAGVVLFGAAACASEPLEPLPERARAEGVVFETEAGGGTYRVALAGAESAPGAGEPIAATATEVVAAGAGPELHIAASRSSWDLKGRSAHFESNVVVTRGDVTMRCNALDVRYAGADTIDTVVATGAVRVEKGGRTAEAARAELVGKTGRITLTGDPRLAEGVNVLEGERIVLWLDDERADCEGGATGPCRLVVAAGALGR
jgi:lipopolysaccharide export system protein LptA